MQNRKELFALIFAYYLLASRGLLFGTIQFYHDASFAFEVWLGVALIMAGFWSVFFVKERSLRLLLMPLAMVLINLPPIGLISWVNPLLSAGLAFPKTSFLGYSLLIALVMLTDRLNMRYLRFSNSLAILVCFTIALSGSLDYTKIANNITPINGNFKDLYAISSNDFLKAYEFQIDYLKMANAAKTRIVLLPENALANFMDLNMMIWQSLNQDKSVYAGATIKDGTQYYDNVLLKVTHKGASVVYKQRLPVPISMWTPFSDNGARAHLFSSATANIEGQKSAVLICYEQLTLWTIWQSMLEEPTQILAISNLFWAADTSIYDIQKNTLELTARLFNVPLAFAVNK